MGVKCTNGSDLGVVATVMDRLMMKKLELAQSDAEVCVEPAAPVDVFRRLRRTLLVLLPSMDLMDCFRSLYRLCPRLVSLWEVSVPTFVTGHQLHVTR